MTAKSTQDSVINPCKVSKVSLYSSVDVQLLVSVEGLPQGFCFLFCQSKFGFLKLVL